MASPIAGDERIHLVTIDWARGKWCGVPGKYSREHLSQFAEKFSLKVTDALAPLVEQSAPLRSPPQLAVAKVDPCPQTVRLFSRRADRLLVWCTTRVNSVIGLDCPLAIDADPPMFPPTVECTGVRRRWIGPRSSPATPFGEEAQGGGTACESSSRRYDRCISGSRCVLLTQLTIRRPRRILELADAHYFCKLSRGRWHSSP